MPWLTEGLPLRETRNEMQEARKERGRSQDISRGKRWLQANPRGTQEDK